MPHQRAGLVRTRKLSKGKSLENVADAGTVLEVKAVSKAFGVVRALDNVSINVREGGIHGLVGQNGAGKSTLMRILAGAVRPDAGELLLDGAPITIRSPAHARGLGISMIHQELNLSPYQTIAENISLGGEPRGSLGFVSQEKMRVRASAALNRIGSSLSVDMPVHRLDVEDRQLVEIAKALASDTRILILDEPTAALEARQVDRLVDVLLRFREQGGTALYVSHRLDEIARLCDVITVLRDGRVAASINARTATREGVVELMIGRPLGDLFPPRASGEAFEPILEARRLTGRSFADLNFTVQRGRILGFGGLEGSGMREVGRVLAGDRTPISGEILVDGKRARYGSSREALRRGIIYVSADRKNEGLFGILSVRENISIGTLSSRLKMGFIALRSERRVVNDSVKRLRIQTPNAAQEVRRLSGGNQQKVLLARWLPARPNVAIFDEPTRGLDVGAKGEIYRLMRELTTQGVGVVMISSDLTEIVGMADEIVALRGGRRVGMFAGGISEADLLGAIL